jgi:hypothetical protein
MNLSWSAPTSNGGSAITAYTIEYRLSNGGTWTSFGDVLGSQVAVTVTGLSNNNSYDFRVTAKNLVGRGSVSSIVTAIPGAPAQVIIQNFSSLVTPNISTAVRITNEGVTAYEYQYTWCITATNVNSCSAGDDIFSSTAAKLIQPGQNFDTVLNSTVTTAGNYWFHMDVKFGSDSSEATQSFVAVAASSNNNTNNNTSSGGGGGGGGGAPATVSLPATTPAPIPSEYQSADFTHSGVVDSTDFSIMLAYWGGAAPKSNPAVDINHDGRVDSIDFSILLYEWTPKDKKI